MKKFKYLFLVSISFLFLLGIFIENKLFNPKLYASPSLRQIAEHWSPIIKQSTETEQDYITNFDFDGNWYGHDNWEHFPCYPRPAYVYYSIIESTDHYIITYFFFHPRDTGNPAWGYVWAHENDQGGCRCVIRKDGSEWGDFGWLETLLHDTRNYYNWAEFEGSHPVVYVTPYKHAVYGENWASWSWDRDYLSPDGSIFPSSSGTGVIYRYQGIAEEPLDLDDRDVSYDLIDLKDTIWARRFGDPHRECDYFIKGRYRLSPNSCGYIIDKAQFGAKFEGDNYSLGARECYVAPPWNKAFDNAGIWFIDPLLNYQDAQGRSWACIGERYVYNPFRNSSSGCPLDCGEVEGPFLIIAGLELIKSASKYYINEGESVTYTYSVRNAGIYPAKNVKITDNQLGLIGNKSVLEAKQWWTVHKTVTLNQTTTNQATATATYYWWCAEDNKTARSNTVTVTVGETPPPEPPDEPPDEPPILPESLIPQAQVMSSWDSTHSFTEDEHSLAHWLKGKTANAHINEKGQIEIKVEPSRFPNVLSSPDLEALLPGKKFNAIRILYLNSIEYTKVGAKGVIGWLDDAMVNEKGHLKPKEKTGKKGKSAIKFQLEIKPDFTWKLIKLKDHPNWEKKAQILGFTFVPVYNDPSAQGKFLIRTIELIWID